MHLQARGNGGEGEDREEGSPPKMGRIVIDGMVVDANFLKSALSTGNISARGDAAAGREGADVTGVVIGSLPPAPTNTDRWDGRNTGAGNVGRTRPSVTGGHVGGEETQLLEPLEPLAQGQGQQAGPTGEDERSHGPSHVTDQLQEDLHSRLDGASSSPGGRGGGGGYGVREGVRVYSPRERASGRGEGGGEEMAHGGTMIEPVYSPRERLGMVLSDLEESRERGWGGGQGSLSQEAEAVTRLPDALPSDALPASSSAHVWDGGGAGGGGKEASGDVEAGWGNAEILRPTPVSAVVYLLF